MLALLHLFSFPSPRRRRPEIKNIDDRANTRCRVPCFRVTVALTLNLRAGRFFLARRHHLSLSRANVHIILLIARHIIIHFIPLSRILYLFIFLCVPPSQGPECMLTEMSTDQMYVVDAFSLFFSLYLPIPYRARLVL